MSSRRRRRSVTADGMTPLDPDRTLALYYVPAKHRPAVEALWRLDAALGAVLAGGREPLIGQIKLVWWRAALEKLDRERRSEERGVGKECVSRGRSRRSTKHKKKKTKNKK